MASYQDILNNLNLRIRKYMWLCELGTNKMLIIIIIIGFCYDRIMIHELIIVAELLGSDF